MNTPFDFGPEVGRTVYVKAVQVAELPDDVQAQLHEQVEGAEQVYAVHSSEGEQLALVADRSLAFVLARQNDYQPVAVH